MAIKHTVPASLPTGTVTGKVAGDDWRADHNHVPFCTQLFMVGGNSGLGLTASAAVGTEILPTSRVARALVDLSNATQIRLVGMIAANGSAATAAIKIQYVAKASEAATWAGADTGVAITVGTGTINTLRDSGWQTLSGGAQIDNCVIAAVVGTAAFGTTAPTVSSLEVWFR